VSTDFVEGKALGDRLPERNRRSAVGGAHCPILAARSIDTLGSIWGPTIYPATFRMRA
jgi:hypothetical protein